MAKYTTLLFDIDDTLLDFLDAERQAIERTFSQNGIPFDEELLRSYSAINLSLWKRFEKGEIEKGFIIEERFRIFGEKHRLSFPVEKVAKEYISNLMYGHTCIAGAPELMRSLYGKYDIYAVTNGISLTQFKRIKDSGLEPYFSDIFVSETTGHQKPSIEYFRYVFEHIKEKDLSKILLIGDSPTSDIRGGNNAGIDTCWYNPHGKPISDVPTYEIDTLEKLHNCL